MEEYESLIATANLGDHGHHEKCGKGSKSNGDYQYRGNVQMDGQAHS
jgi:hypothetical protein